MSDKALSERVQNTQNYLLVLLKKFLFFSPSFKKTTFQLICFVPIFTKLEACLGIHRKLSNGEILLSLSNYQHHWEYEKVAWPTDSNTKDWQVVGSNPCSAAAFPFFLYLGLVGSQGSHSLYSTWFLLHDRSLYCTRFFTSWQSSYSTRFLFHVGVHTVQDFYFMTRFIQYKIFTSWQGSYSTRFLLHDRLGFVQYRFFTSWQRLYSTGFLLHDRVHTVQDFSSQQGSYSTGFLLHDIGGGGGGSMFVF